MMPLRRAARLLKMTSQEIREQFRGLGLSVYLVRPGVYRIRHEDFDFYVGWSGRQAAPKG